MPKRHHSYTFTFDELVDFVRDISSILPSNPSDRAYRKITASILSSYAQVMVKNIYAEEK